jgi:hypothetical protein
METPMENHTKASQLGLEVGKCAVADGFRRLSRPRRKPMQSLKHVLTEG